MQFSLKFLNDYSIDTNENTYLALPEIFDNRDPIANQILPWRSFMARNGSYPLKHWPFYLIEPYVSLNLTGLKDIDKNIANGEILGVTLLMEDLLSSKNSENFDDDDEEEATDGESTTGAAAAPVVKKNADQQEDEVKKVVAPMPFNIIVNNYKRWRNFLLTWKRLELLKLDWGRRKLGVEKIDTTEAYSTYSENYKKDILVPVLKILVKNSENKENRDYYNNIVDYKQPILLPQDISELQSKMKQVISSKEVN